VFGTNCTVGISSPSNSKLFVVLVYIMVALSVLFYINVTFGLGRELKIVVYIWDIVNCYISVVFALRIFTIT
jgi:hypothetical protein